MLFRAAKILISCDSDIHIKDNIITSSPLTDIPQIQQLPFDQAALDFPVTPQSDSYDDDVRELTNIGTFTRRLVATVVTISTGCRILRGAWRPSSVTTTSTGNKLSRY